MQADIWLETIKCDGDRYVEDTQAGKVFVWDVYFAAEFIFEMNSGGDDTGELLIYGDGSVLALHDGGWRTFSTLLDAHRWMAELGCSLIERELSAA
jgi:hypothetical protein